MRELRERVPRARVIVLTSFLDDDKLLPALRAGAAGYLLKNAPPPELARAVRAAHAGEALLDPVVAARLVETLAGDGDPLDRLTPREREVLELIGRGFPNKRIARRLEALREDGEDPCGACAGQARRDGPHPGGRRGRARRARRPGVLGPIAAGGCDRPGPYRGRMPVGIVTGASRGLGLALSRALAERGWRLVVDARGAEALADATDELGGVVAIPGDVADPEHRRALVEAAGAPIDLLVNNASLLGPSPQPALADYPLPELARVYEVNLLAPLALVQLALPRLAPARRSSTSRPTRPSSPTRAGAATDRRRPRSSS
jgi:CheY-like chemotaxis protein